MKAKFTFLVVLFLLATNIYALEPVHNKSRKLTGGFLRNRLERTEKSTAHSPFQRKMGFQKQTAHLKSAQAIKQRLDSYTSHEWDEISGQWIPEYKVEFTYDANWNMTQELDYEMDETIGQLILYWKSDYSYDANGNMIQEIYYERDEDTNQITVDYKETYSYDANGNVTQVIGYEWANISNTFVTDLKYDYTYDAIGNMTQEIESYFDANHVETKTKKEYKYENKDKLTLTTSFEFSKETNEWTKGNTEEFTYDSKGNRKIVVINEYIGYWDGIDQYRRYNKEEYSYDSKGNNILVNKTDYAGSGNGIDFYSYEKDEYTYDANGHVTQYQYSRMVNNEWVVYNKDTNVYDDKGNNTQSIFYYDWDVSTSQWNDVWKSETTFDNNYTINDLILPFDMVEDEEGFFTHMITEIKGYEWNIYTKAWILDYKTSLTYSAQNVTSINSFNSELSRVYPNPFDESLSFSIPGSYSQISFELFDLQGRKLFEKAIGSNEKVNMEGFRSGMYLYRLNADSKIQNGKLVKE